MAIFDDSFARSIKERNTRRARHGMTWPPVEMEQLRDLYMQGHSLCKMCEVLERPAQGILPKLCDLGLIEYCAGQYFILRMPNPVKNLTSTITEIKESQVTAPITITYVTLLNGRSITEYSDTELYGLIAREELEIEKLCKVRNQPQRLQNEIARRQKGILELVAFMDAQEAGNVAGN